MAAMTKSAFDSPVARLDDKRETVAVNAKLYGRSRDVTLVKMRFSDEVDQVGEDTFIDFVRATSIDRLPAS